MFRGSVKSTGYPLHSPVSPSLPRPCGTVCHEISTRLYHPTVALANRLATCLVLHEPNLLATNYSFAHSVWQRHYWLSRLIETNEPMSAFSRDRTSVIAMDNERRTVNTRYYPLWLFEDVPQGDEYCRCKRKR